MWGIEKLGIIVVIILTAFFVVSFFLGRSLNFKLQRNIYRFIAQEIKPYFKKVTYSTYGSNAFTLIFPVEGKKEVPFKTFEATALLMDRENIIHYLYSKAKGDHDKLILKANLNSKCKHKFLLELVAKNSIFFKKANKSFASLKTIKLKGFTENFLVKTSNPQLAKEALSSLSKIPVFKNVKSHILRLSISSEKPHLILVYNIEKPVNGVFQLLWEYGKMLNNLLQSKSR